MDHTLNHTWKSQIPYPKLKSVWSSCQHTPNQALFLPPPTSHPPSSPALFRRPSCVVRGDHWLSHLSRVLIRHNPSQGFERRDPPAVPVCPDTTLSGTGIYIYIYTGPIGPGVVVPGGVNGAAVLWQSHGVSGKHCPVLGAQGTHTQGGGSVGRTDTENPAGNWKYSETYTVHLGSFEVCLSW